MRSVDVASVEWVDGVEGGTPQRVLLAVDVHNGGAAAVMRQGRLRVSYSGRTVLMFTLDGRVKIPRRHDGVIVVPLRVNVARNSQMVAFNSALERHDATNMEVDWEVFVRVGVVGSRIVQPREPLAEVLQGDKLESVWQMTDEIKEDR